MKYRKKPVVIEAVQWFPNSNIEGVYQIESGKTDGFTGMTNYNDYPIGVIKTLEGNMIAIPGDYIITGVQGEKYPCKPDIFKETYELMDE